ncbi:UNVERIFIED_ORG: hypothetical protein BDU10_5479 [Burkholderia sp. CF145]
MDAAHRNSIDVPKWKCRSNHLNEGAPIMKITTVDVDPAKDAFSVHGVNKRDRTVLRKVLKRRHAVEFFANLSPV